MKMDGVREYAENMDVELVTDERESGDPDRLLVYALNEGGHNCTLVDLLDLLKWVKTNRPELWDLA